MDTYKIITEKIISELEKGVIPWQKPWRSAQGAVSHVTGKPYSLLNQLLLEGIGDRPMTVCRELTKKHEQIIRTTIREALLLYQQTEPRGEYALVIAGRDRREMLREKQEMIRSSISLAEHMEQYTSAGMDRKEAMKAVTKDRGLSKRDVYRMLLEETGET